LKPVAFWRDRSFDSFPLKSIDFDSIRGRNEFRTLSSHALNRAFQSAQTRPARPLRGQQRELDRWREFNASYHDDDRKFMRFLIPPGKRVLELGCSRGDLLAS
jgi:hypothetical protein